MSLCKFHCEPKIIWNISYRIRCKVYIIITKEVSLRFYLCRVVTRPTWRVYRSFIRLAFNSFSSSSISNEHNSLLQQANHELYPVQLKKDGFCVLFLLFNSQVVQSLNQTVWMRVVSWGKCKHSVSDGVQLRIFYFLKRLHAFTTVVRLKLNTTTVSWSYLFYQWLIRYDFDLLRILHKT